MPAHLVVDMQWRFLNARSDEEILPLTDQWNFGNLFWSHFSRWKFPLALMNNKEADMGTRGLHRVVCVGDHMSAVLAAATKGDVRMVRQMLDRNFDLDHAEPASKEALSKLTAYLELAEDIERTYGHGALLEIDDPIVASLIGHNCFSEEKLCAARQFRKARDVLGTESIQKLLGEVSRIIEGRRIRN